MEKENVDQKAILQARKHNLSGKRRVIDGKHLMTEAELIGIQEAQEVTKQRKGPQKGKGTRKGRPKAKKESSDESEADSNIPDDEDVKLLDCIVVET
jgi:hypothetical protein